jgi:hypothetical protein
MQRVKFGEFPANDDGVELTDKRLARFEYLHKQTMNIQARLLTGEPIEQIEFDIIRLKSKLEII